MNSPTRSKLRALLIIVYRRAPGNEIHASAGQPSVGWNAVGKGPNGTAYMASDSIFHSTGPNAANAIAGTFIHELGNILDAKVNPTGVSGKHYESTYGNPHDPEDIDTGAALERCVFGGQLQYPYP